MNKTNGDLSWFRPMYRRVLLVGGIAVWSAWEWFGNHDQFWGLLTLAMLAYGVWTFFISFDKSQGGDGDGQQPKG